jgi:endonuclease YncB( thermonuclease family)
MAEVVRPDFRRSRHAGERAPGVVRRVVGRYQLIELSLIIGAILLLWGAASLGRVHTALTQSPPTWPDPARIDIIDGDTVQSGAQIYRLVGFNTPESGPDAKCSRERALGAAATRRLNALIANGELDLRRVACACPRGTEGTGQCNYGRLCATLRVDGRDVSTILIAEGLAESYVCGATACPPRRNWCLS